MAADQHDQQDSQQGLDDGRERDLAAERAAELRAHLTQDEDQRQGARLEADLIRRARGAYEAACARLRTKTAAAWVSWEELDPDGKATWIEACRRSGV